MSSGIILTQQLENTDIQKYLIDYGKCNSNQECEESTHCCSEGKCSHSSLCLIGTKNPLDHCTFEYECRSRCCVEGKCGDMGCQPSCTHNQDCSSGCCSENKCTHDIVCQVNDFVDYNYKFESQLCLQDSLNCTQQINNSTSCGEKLTFLQVHKAELARVFLVALVISFILIILWWLQSLMNLQHDKNNEFSRLKTYRKGKYEKIGNKKRQQQLQNHKRKSSGGGIHEFMAGQYNPFSITKPKRQGKQNNNKSGRRSRSSQFDNLFPDQRPPIEKKLQYNQRRGMQFTGELRPRHRGTTVDDALQYYDQGLELSNIDEQSNETSKQVDSSVHNSTNFFSSSQGLQSSHERIKEQNLKNLLIQKLHQTYRRETFKMSKIDASREMDQINLSSNNLLSRRSVKFNDLLINKLEMDLENRADQLFAEAPTPLTRMTMTVADMRRRKSELEKDIMLAIGPEEFSNRQNQGDERSDESDLFRILKSDRSSDF